MPTKPAVVALLRGLIEAALLAATGGLLVWMEATNWGDLAPFAIPAVLAVRAGEGLIDQKIDPTTQRGKLGGAPSIPYAEPSE